MRKAIIIMTAALLVAACSGDKETKVNYKLYLDWPERQLPDFSTLGEPDITGIKNNLDLVGIDETLNHYAVLFETTLKVKTEEDYTFKITTDDGSKLYIDGELLIDNDGAHGPITKTATTRLTKGRHDLCLEYFDNDKGQSINFLYSTPTMAWRELNDHIMRDEDKASDRAGFVKPQIKETLKRYKEWKGTDETLVFPVVTDVHTAGRFSYKHISHAVKAAEAFGSDFMVNLGDIGLNAYPATESSEYARQIIRNTRERMDEYDGVWLYTPGNHDWDAGEGNFLTESELNETFQKPWQERAGADLHLIPGKTYGWYDVKGFRVIFLNSQGTGTQGGHYYLFDDAQVEWLQGLLDSTPERMPVIVLTHYMPHPLGRWTTTAPTEEALWSNSRLMGVLSGFAAKGTLVGLFTGDAHVNMYTREDGVNYFISQGYGWVVPDLMLPGTRHAFFDYKDSLCIDMIAVKPGKREVHTFRIGAGGKDYDSSFSY